MEETSFEVSSVSEEEAATIDDVIDYTEWKRSFNLRQIKTYNLIKNSIWNCVMPTEAEVNKEDMVVELVLLRDLMKELQSFIDFYSLKE